MRQVPIYTTHGDWAAMLVDDVYLYNPQGEWIGWIDEGKSVYSVRGDYAGWLSKDYRVLRQRDTTQLSARRKSPPAPPRLRLPPFVALAPMMAELSYDTIDLFEEAPHRLDPMDLDNMDDLD